MHGVLRFLVRISNGGQFLTLKKENYKKKAATKNSQLALFLFLLLGNIPHSFATWCWKFLDLRTKFVEFFVAQPLKRNREKAALAMMKVTPRKTSKFA